jgi:hypothetical protein
MVWAVQFGLSWGELGRCSERGGEQGWFTLLVEWGIGSTTSLPYASRATAPFGNGSCPV